MKRRDFLTRTSLFTGAATLAGMLPQKLLANGRNGISGNFTESKLKIFDMHVHVHNSRPFGVARPNGMQFPTPEILIDMMDNAGIAKAAVMSYVSPEGRYTHVIPEETVEICARYPDRLIPFCSVDSRQLTNSVKADFGPMLLAYKNMGCKGIGEYVTHIPMDDPLNLNLFRYVEEIGFPLTFHLASKIGGIHGCYDDPGLPRLENVLKRFPKMTFIGHSEVFWSEIGHLKDPAERSSYPKGKIKKEGRLIHLMRSYPNLHADLSAGSGYNAISRDPEFGYRFMEEFQDRLYFGTDVARVPYDLPIIPYFRELKEKRLIPDVAYEKITWYNAVRLMNITE